MLVVSALVPCLNRIMNIQRVWSAGCALALGGLADLWHFIEKDTNILPSLFILVCIIKNAKLF